MYFTRERRGGYLKVPVLGSVPSAFDPTSLPSGSWNVIGLWRTIPKNIVDGSASQVQGGAQLKKRSLAI